MGVHLMIGDIYPLHTMAMFKLNIMLLEVYILNSFYQPQ